MDRAIILMSGGLDSIVSLDIAKKTCNIDLALTFNYGQKSLHKELKASKNICEYYKIKHKIITLDWLKEIINNSTTEFDNKDWIPNRNGLFLNIAGCFAESFGYKYIIFGANCEEAKQFSDNTKEFTNAINSEFNYSTSTNPKVIAPLINYNKNDIVKHAIKNNVPLELISSCYENTSKHCGKCESCIKLKKALIANNDTKYIRILFE